MNITLSNIKVDWQLALKYAIALFTVGGTANMLYDHVSPFAGYALVGIVLIGFAVDPNRWTPIDTFFKTVGGQA